MIKTHLGLITQEQEREFVAKCLRSVRENAESMGIVGIEDEGSNLMLQTLRGIRMGIRMAQTDARMRLTTEGDSL